MPFSQLGFCTKLFCLHRLRSGSATAVDDAGVNDGLFEHHGRWPCNKSKDGYVQDNLSLLCCRYPGTYNCNPLSLFLFLYLQSSRYQQLSINEMPIPDSGLRYGV